MFILWRYWYYWQKLSIWETPPDFIPSTKITVIIPVRNEEKNIETCLQSILKQAYPTDLLELIIIDDHSTDNTFQILKQFKEERLRVFQLADFIDPAKGYAFKKKAIEIAIGKSGGDLIITTDGDCLTPPRWLQRIAHFYEINSWKFIAAPVNFYQEQNMLEYFQSLDFTGMMGITGAGIQGGFMNMCNGANLAYDKKAFYEVGGFEGIDHLASGDDMLLMQKIARRFPGEIGYLKNRAATVKTKAQESLNAFFNQRLRWASKSSDYKELQVTLMLGMVWVFCISILFSVFSIFFIGTIGFWILISQVVIKIIIDFLLLKTTTRFFNRADLMKYFFPSQVMHILYIAIIGTLSIFIKKYTWKGRKTS